MVYMARKNIIEKKRSIAEISLNEILEEKSDASHLKGYLRISLYEGCNQSCFFCHNEGASTQKELIDTSKMWKAVRASIGLGKHKFKFTGGEPTLHPKLVEYVTRIKQMDKQSEVGIVTNGTLLHEIGCDLVEAGADKITISLHSLEHSNFKKITAFDALDKVMLGLDTMDKTGFNNIVINMAVTKINLHEVENMNDFANQRGYKLRLLDILPSKSSVDEVKVESYELKKMFPHLKIKPKKFYNKCKRCDNASKCGEGEYLRLSAKGVLNPCLYKDDLAIPLNSNDNYNTILKKVALGFRRIEKDNL